MTEKEICQHWEQKAPLKKKKAHLLCVSVPLNTSWPWRIVCLSQAKKEGLEIWWLSHFGEEGAPLWSVLKMWKRGFGTENKVYKLTQKGGGPFDVCKVKMLDFCQQQNSSRHTLCRVRVCVCACRFVILKNVRIVMFGLAKKSIQHPVCAWEEPDGFGKSSPVGQERHLWRLYA